MSATMQALIFEMLPNERRTLRDQIRETAVTLVEHLPVQQEVDGGWELFEMRFQEHSARATFNDVFATAFLQTED
jgi:ferric iron reductase protein FhuF